MTKRKYIKGRQITSIGEFENSKNHWFIVRYGNNLKTTHRGFLISWQYAVLKKFIDNGYVFEAINLTE